MVAGRLVGRAALYVFVAGATLTALWYVRLAVFVNVAVLKTFFAHYRPCRNWVSFCFVFFSGITINSYASNLVKVI